MDVTMDIGLPAFQAGLVKYGLYKGFELFLRAGSLASRFGVISV
jgi:hypothetical protein